MTDEQIDRMLVLDALIGKEIMHAEPTVYWIASDDNGKSMTNGFVSEPAAKDWCAGHPPYKPIRCERWERYTSDPCASKRLRDKMRSEGWQYSIDWCDERFRTAFWKNDESDNLFWENFSTEEMSVGLSACKAKGIEVG